MALVSVASVVLVQKDAHHHAIWTVAVVSHPVVTDHHHCHSLEFDLAETKAKLSTALAAKEALMIGSHSSDIANRLDQEILALRRALTDQRPLGEQLAGIQGVIARGEKRLNLALAERERVLQRPYKLQRQKLLNNVTSYRSISTNLKPCRRRLSALSALQRTRFFKTTAWA